MPIPKKLVNYLERSKVKFEMIKHRTVYTAWDAAQTLHVKPSQIVKTLVVKLRGKVPALVLIPANRNLDKKKFSNVAYNLTQKVTKDLSSRASANEPRDLRRMSVPHSRETSRPASRQGGQARGDSYIIPSEWNYPSPDLKGKSYSIEFAKEKWMKEKLLGKVGATPPFGRMLKMPVFIDKALFREKELILNSGDYNISIKMKSKDFEKLEHPLSGSFSVKK